MTRSILRRNTSNKNKTRRVRFNNRLTIQGFQPEADKRDRVQTPVERTLAFDERTKEKLKTGKWTIDSVDDNESIVNLCNVKTGLCVALAVGSVAFLLNRNSRGGDNRKTRKSRKRI